QIRRSAAKLLDGERIVGAGNPAAQVGGEFAPVELLLVADVAKFGDDFYRFSHARDAGLSISPAGSLASSLVLAQFAAGDGHAMHFVGAVGDSERAAVAPHP